MHEALPGGVRRRVIGRAVLAWVLAAVALLLALAGAFTAADLLRLERVGVRGVVELDHVDDEVFLGSGRLRGDGTVLEVGLEGGESPGDEVEVLYEPGDAVNFVMADTTPRWEAAIAAAWGAIALFVTVWLVLFGSGAVRTIRPLRDRERRGIARRWWTAGRPQRVAAQVVMWSVWLGSAVAVLLFVGSSGTAAFGSLVFGAVLGPVLASVLLPSEREPVPDSVVALELTGGSDGIVRLASWGLGRQPLLRIGSTHLEVRHPAYFGEAVVSVPRSSVAVSALADVDVSDQPSLLLNVLTLPGRSVYSAPTTALLFSEPVVTPRIRRLERGHVDAVVGPDGAVVADAMLVSLAAPDSGHERLREWFGTPVADPSAWLQLRRTSVADGHPAHELATSAGRLQRWCSVFQWAALLVLVAGRFVADDSPWLWPVVGLALATLAAASLVRRVLGRREAAALAARDAPTVIPDR